MADDYVSYVRDRNTGVVKEIHDEGARTALATKYELGLGTEIPSGADLNDYVTPGVYKIQSAAVAQTIVNKPPQNGSAVSGCRVMVEDNMGNICQMWVCENNGLTYVRRKLSSGWEDWQGQLDFTRFNASNNRDITDMLLVSLSSKTSPVNKPCFVSSNNASTLINMPMAYNGTFIGFRTVDWLFENRVFVTLHELYPEQGRVWTNHYNATDWSGWRASGGIGSIIAEGVSNGWQWIKYSNGMALLSFNGSVTSSPYTTFGGMWSGHQVTLALPFGIALGGYSYNVRIGNGFSAPASVSYNISGGLATSIVVLGFGNVAEQNVAFAYSGVVFGRWK